MPIDIDHILKTHWGYDSFRELQREIIESVLDGHDTLGLLPTGGGKSITFQVPALALPGLTIVVSPLIALMKDQVDNLLQRGIRAYGIHSGLTRGETRLAMDKCRLGKAKILYVSPERLQNERFLEELERWDVSLLVVDEAHCISQWGYDFRPAYLKLKKLRAMFPDAPVLALTASATPRVADDIMQQLQFRQGCNKFAKSFSRPNISYIVRYDDYKERTLLKVLANTSGSAIVYVRSRRRCREIADMLSAHGIPAQYYHAGLAIEDKNERQSQWKDEHVRVMVATNAFGMGIDKPDVRVVAHMDIPSSLEEYYQEAGRAGRDGKPSYAVMIVSKADKGMLTRRISDTFPPRDYIMKVYEQAGNFLSVSLGAGYQQVYEFNFPEFCHKFGLRPVNADAALRILTRAQYVEYIDEVQSHSRVMILASKSEFYTLALDDATNRVFSELQRLYTGLFADYVHIEESAIALRAGVSEEQVYVSMLKLSQQKVVSYVPKKATPYLIYTTSREEPKYLRLPKAVYEDRKRDMEERIESVRSYAFDSTDCRVRRMLQYFGEIAAGPCGCCDVCRSQRKPSNTAGFADIYATLRYVCSHPGGCTLQQAVASVGAERARVVEAVRRLLDDGELVMNNDRLECRVEAKPTDA